MAHPALKGTSPDLRKVIEKAIEQGYIIRKTGNKHLQLVPPDKTKEIITVGVSVSDHRAHKNIRSMLRRQGANV